MSKSDISFLWPLTALSFVFATFAAMWFLHERVSAIRWAGVILIMIGAAFISYDEQTRAKPPEVSKTAAQAPSVARGRSGFATGRSASIGLSPCSSFKVIPLPKPLSSL